VLQRHAGERREAIEVRRAGTRERVVLRGINRDASSRSAPYQYWLIVSTSTSIPCSSIARSRASFITRLPFSCPRTVFSRGVPLTIVSSADGTAVCACTSTVRTRRPATRTSRRRGA
jgi:hypothetical protein